MSSQNEVDPDNGAVLRWVINTDGEDNFNLILLALPSSASAIKGRPAFKRDTCPGQRVYREMVEVDFDHTVYIRGPRPVIFTPDPKQTAKHLKEERDTIDRVFKGNTKLKKKIYHFSNQKYPKKIISYNNTIY
jgi:hypothetical protein